MIARAIALAALMLAVLLSIDCGHGDTSAAYISEAEAPSVREQATQAACLASVGATWVCVTRGIVRVP